MTLIKDRVIIKLTEEERKAIETVKKLTNDLFYGLTADEKERLNSIMVASWGAGSDDIEVAVGDLSCLLDNFQEDINKFNAGIDLN